MLSSIFGFLFNTTETSVPLLGVLTSDVNQSVPTPIGIVKITTHLTNEEIIKNNNSYFVNSGDIYKIYINSYVGEVEILNGTHIVSERGKDGNTIICMMPYFFDKDDIFSLTNKNSDMVTLICGNDKIDLSFVENKENSKNVIARKFYFVNTNIKAINLLIKEETNTQIIDELIKRKEHFEKIFSELKSGTLESEIPEFINFSEN